MKSPTDYLLQATGRPAAALEPTRHQLSWAQAEAAVAQALADSAEYRRLLLRAVRHHQHINTVPYPADV